MSVEEASKQSGYSPFMLRKFARDGEFVASKPMGNRRGWDINDVSFRRWMSDRNSSRSNRRARQRRATLVSK